MRKREILEFECSVSDYSDTKPQGRVEEKKKSSRAKEDPGYNREEANPRAPRSVFKRRRRKTSPL